MPPWTKASKRYVSFNQSVEIRDTIRSCFLRSLTFFHCWCMRHIGSHSLQTDQPKCFTLQGQSLECYSRHKTFYKSLQYSTNEKLSSWHLVCHAFLSMTFAFCSCSRSVEALNCLSDWRKTEKNMENSFEYLMKTKNQMLNHIKSANWNEQSNPIRSDVIQNLATRHCSHHSRSY